MADWQPIDTASPRGAMCSVILWNGKTVETGWYCDEDGMWFPDVSGNFNDWLDPQPTHWQPLPDPPQPKA